MASERNTRIIIEIVAIHKPPIKAIMPSNSCIPFKYIIWYAATQIQYNRKEDAQNIENPANLFFSLLDIILYKSPGKAYINENKIANTDDQKYLHIFLGKVLVS